MTHATYPYFIFIQFNSSVLREYIWYDFIFLQICQGSLLAPVSILVIFMCIWKAFISYPALLRYNWHITCKLRYPTCWFATLVYCIVLAKTPPSRYIITTSFLWWEHSGSLSNFEGYNTVLLTVITMLCTPSSELSHGIAGSLYALTVISPSPPALAPSNHDSIIN